MKIRDITMISLFTALIIVGAFIKIPLPTCPITLQILFTTLSGVFLGGKKGAAAVGVYIFLGLIGLPVFTGGGGLGYIFQPTFGYIIGFLIGTYLTGTIAHSGEPTVKRLLIACFSGLFIVFAMGVIYCWAISQFWLGSPMGIWPLLFKCVFLPLPGDIFLCIFSAFLGHRLIPVMKRMAIRST